MNALSVEERMRAKANALGHDVVEDGMPGARLTCRCGMAVLYAGGPIYGSATTTPCPQPAAPGTCNEKRPFTSARCTEPASERPHVHSGRDTSGRLHVWVTTRTAREAFGNDR